MFIKAPGTYKQPMILRCYPHSQLFSYCSNLAICAQRFWWRGEGCWGCAQEFLVKWPVQEQLKRLVGGGGGGDAVLVRKHAKSLLDAFRVNTVF